MEEFMAAMIDVFPQVLVQFEDFSTDNAFKYLELFRNRYQCFNDDVRLPLAQRNNLRNCNSVRRFKGPVQSYCLDC
jgi:hypothetical protein